MSTKQLVSHTLEPWFDEHSKVLILGTMPSPKSREQGCYYGHPQNRFWKTLSSVISDETPFTVEDRRAFVKKHHIALWDVLESCFIHAAEDSSIEKPITNDISIILNSSDIQAIFTTGMKSKQLYDREIFPKIHRDAIALPSTSPANRRWYSDEDLIKAYSILRKYI